MAGAKALEDKNGEVALESFSEAAEIDPQSMDILYGRALAYLLTGQYEQAIQDSSQIISQEPYNNKVLPNKISLWLFSDKTQSVYNIL